MLVEQCGELARVSLSVNIEALALLRDTIRPGLLVV
jgi:hypothetical protein